MARDLIKPAEAPEIHLVKVRAQRWTRFAAIMGIPSLGGVFGFVVALKGDFVGYIVAFGTWALHVLLIRKAIELWRHEKPSEVYVWPSNQGG